MALRLGEALVQEGLIDNQQLSKALERQVIYGGRLGTNLIELGLLTEESLVRFMGKVFGVPYADPKAFEGIKRGIVDSIAPEIAERYLVIPIDREPKRLHLAMVNPTDLRVIDEVRFITGLRDCTLYRLRAPHPLCLGEILRHSKAVAFHFGDL